MLVLTRRANAGNDSTIMITDRQGRVIEVHVNDINREGVVRLGVSAPREVSVDRLEIAQSKAQGRRP